VVYKGQNWLDVISRHRNSLSGDTRDCARALQMYNGTYWTTSQRTDTPTLTSFNMVFAIAESASSMLVPTNVRYSINAVNGKTQWIPDDLEERLEDYAEIGDWRNEAVISVVDAVLTGRSVIKVIPDFDPAAASPVSLRAIRPQQILFDLTARRPSDVAWFAETQLVDWPTFERRVRERIYRVKDSGNLLDWFTSRAGAWPEALGGVASTASQSGSWLRLYEVWDKNTRCMSVWCDGCTEPLTYTVFSPKKWSFPYVIYNLNYNGENCLGLSEVQLCLDNIEAMNRTLSWMMATVRRQVPVTAYNSNQLGESDISRLASALPGDFVAVRPAGLSSLEGLFLASPIPQVSGDMSAMFDKLQQIISYTSALADASRGQVTGARTATELALIESQQRTRNGSRESRFRQAWGRAGALVVWHITGRSKALADVMRSTKLVAYNSSDSNRAVLRENFEKLSAYMTARNAESAETPPFDQAEIDRLFVQINGLPDGILAEKEAEDADMPEGVEDADIPEDAALPEMEQVEDMGEQMVMPGMPGMPPGIPQSLPPIDMPDLGGYTQ